MKPSTVAEVCRDNIFVGFNEPTEHSDQAYRSSFNSWANPILLVEFAFSAERWQSGRMRRTRNPVYGSFVSRVRIPLSPPLFYCLKDYFLIVFFISIYKLPHL